MIHPSDILQNKYTHSKAADFTVSQHCSQRGTLSMVLHYSTVKVQGTKEKSEFHGFVFSFISMTCLAYQYFELPSLIKLSYETIPLKQEPEVG